MLKNKLNMNLNVLRESLEGSAQSIIDLLCELIKLQGRYCAKEGLIRIMFKKPYCHIDEDENVQNLVTKLFTNPFLDRNEIFALQQNIYHSLMKIEVGNLGREMTGINAKSTKLRKKLRSVTDDYTFKICIELLDKKRSCDRALIGKKNDKIWSAAVESKKELDWLIDKWKGKILAIRKSSINKVDEAVNPVPGKSVDSLSMNPVKFINIEPH